MTALNQISAFSSKLDFAKWLIRDGEPLVKIPAQVGFSEYPGFCRWFKRLAGVTPGQWRMNGVMR